MCQGFGAYSSIHVLVYQCGCCGSLEIIFEHVHLLFSQELLSSLGGTAFETGTAKSDTYCGKSAKNCASCNGDLISVRTKQIVHKEYIAHDMNSCGSQF